MDDIYSETAADVPHRDVPRGADIVSEILFRNFVTFGISSCSIVRYPMVNYTVAFDGQWPATKLTLSASGGGYGEPPFRQVTT
jgi:hypothetical protein